MKVIELTQIDINKPQNMQDFINLRKIDNANDFSISDYLKYRGKLDQIEIKHFVNMGEDYYVFVLHNKELFYIRGKQTFEKIKRQLENISGREIRIKVLNHMIQVQNNPSLPSSTKNQEHVEKNIFSYPLITLVKLYEQAVKTHNVIDSKNYDDFKKLLLMEIARKLRQASIDEKINILKQLEGENSDQLNLVRSYVLLSLQKDSDVDKLISVFGVEKLNRWVKSIPILPRIGVDYVSLDTQPYKIGFDKVSKQSLAKFGPDGLVNILKLALAFQDGYNHLGNVNAFATLLAKTLNKEDINQLDDKLTDYSNVVNNDLAFYKEEIKKYGLINGILVGMKQKNAPEGARVLVGGAIYLLMAVGIFVGIYKLFKKLHRRGALALLAGGTWAFTGTDAGKELLKFFNQVLYGPLPFANKKSLKNIVGETEVDTQTAYELGLIGFVDTIFAGFSVKEIKKYCKIENGKVTKFDLDKFIQDLKAKNPEDPRLALLESIKGAKGMIIEGLNLLNIANAKESQKINTVTVRKAKEIRKQSQQTHSNQSSATTKHISSHTSTKPISKQSSLHKVVANKENMENYIKQTYIIKRENNTVFITNPKGEVIQLNLALDRRFLSPEAKSRYDLLADIMSVWLYNAYKSGDEKVKKMAKEIESFFNQIPNKAFENPHLYKSYIGQLFDKMANVEYEESIIGSEDLGTIKIWLLDLVDGNKFKNENKDKLEIAILNKMRKGWLFDSGDTYMVKNIVADKLIQKKYPNVGKFLNAVIKDKNFSIIDLERKLKEAGVNEYIPESALKKLVVQLTKIYLKIEEAQLKQQKLLKAGYEQFIKHTKLDKNSFTFEDYKKYIAKVTFARTAKQIILYAIVDNLADRGDNTTYTGLYADIVGLGETKWGDLFNVADENIDFTQEIAFTILTSWFPAAAAYTVVRGAILARKAARIAQLAKDAKEMSSLEKALWTGADMTLSSGAGYVASGAVEFFRTGENPYTLSGYAEFLTFDALFRFGGLIWAKYFKDGSFARKTVGVITLGVVGAEVGVNIPRAFKDVELEFNPANWTKEDITTALLILGTLGVGRWGSKKIIEFKKGDYGTIKVKVGEPMKISEASLKTKEGFIKEEIEKLHADIEELKKVKSSGKLDSYYDSKIKELETELEKQKKELLKVEDEIKNPKKGKFAISPEFLELTKKNIESKIEKLTKEIEDLKNIKSSGKLDSYYDSKIKELESRLSSKEEELAEVKKEIELYKQWFKKFFSSEEKLLVKKIGKEDFSFEIDKEGKKYKLFKEDGKYKVEILDEKKTIEFANKKEFLKYINDNGLKEEFVKQGNIKLTEKYAEKAKQAYDIKKGAKEVTINGEKYIFPKKPIEFEIDGANYRIGKKGDEFFAVKFKKAGKNIVYEEVIPLDDFLKANADKIYAKAFEKFLKKNGLWDKKIPKGVRIPEFMKKVGVKAGDTFGKVFNKLEAVQAWKEGQGFWGKFGNLVKLALVGDTKILIGKGIVGWLNTAIAGVVWYNYAPEIWEEFKKNEYGKVGWDFLDAVAWNMFTIPRGLVRLGTEGYKAIRQDDLQTLVDETTS